MSLYWNAQRVEGWDELHNTAPKGEEPKYEKGSPEDLEGDRQWIISESLIYRFMGVDMGSLKEENIEEFFIRNQIVSSLIGKPFRMDGKDADFTIEDLRRRTGLSCNVLTTSRAAFKKRWWSFIEREATASYRNAVRAGDGSLAGSGVGSVSTQPRKLS